MIPHASLTTMMHNNSVYYDQSTTFGPFGVLALVYSLLTRWKRPPLPLVVTKRPGVAVITGCNTGIGLESARRLMNDAGMTVVFACRSRDRAVKVMAAHPRAVFVAPLDLTDPASIKAFCVALKSQFGSQSVATLVNNAGVNTTGALPGQRDLLFAANLLGHFQLTHHLVSQNMFVKNDARVINLSSVMHHFGSLSAPPDDKATWLHAAHYGTSDKAIPVYSLTKLAAILLTKELNQRYLASRDIASIAVNPGGVASDIWRTYPAWQRWLFQKIYLTPYEGSTTTVAAVAMDHNHVRRHLEANGNVLYLQPYHTWGMRTPMFPVLEMLGPYQGAVVTVPRLPKDGGEVASQAMWEACCELVDLTWSKE